MNGSKVAQAASYDLVAPSFGWVTSARHWLRLHVIPLSDGEIGSYGRAYTVTPSQIHTLVDAANQAFAKAGLQFVFNEATDWEPMQDTALNSLNDDNSTWWKYPNQIAARYPGKIVVFLRWGVGSTNGNPDPTKASTNAFAYPPDTGVPIPPDAPLPTPHADFIAFYNSAQSMDPPTFVHELGHYLGLYHTFPGWSDNLTSTSTSAAAKISAASNSAAVLDGDLLLDTPTEAGTAYYTTYVSSNPCSPTNSYHISGITFAPDRQNIMGYLVAGVASLRTIYRVSKRYRSV